VAANHVRYQSDASRHSSRRRDAALRRLEVCFMSAPSIRPKLTKTKLTSPWCATAKRQLQRLAHLMSAEEATKAEDAPFLQTTATRIGLSQGAMYLFVLPAAARQLKARSEWETSPTCCMERRAELRCSDSAAEYGESMQCETRCECQPILTSHGTHDSPSLRLA